MAITTTINVNRHNGNGVTTVFAYTFKIALAADIKVYVGGVLQTLTTHYTLSGIGAINGGNVTFVTAPPTGTANVVFERIVTIDQQTDFPEGGKFPADQVESDFDKRTTVEQQLQAALDRSIKLTTLSLVGGENFEITSLAAVRAGKLVAFNSAGTGIDLLVNPGVFGPFTAGSIIFANAAGQLAQDNANLFWDDTNNKLGIGTTTPSLTLHVNGTLGCTGRLSILNSANVERGFLEVITATQGLRIDSDAEIAFNTNNTLSMTLSAAGLLTLPATVTHSIAGSVQLSAAAQRLLLAGGITFTDSATGAVSPRSIFGSATALNLVGGSSSTDFYNSALSVVRMSLADNGVLTLPIGVVVLGAVTNSFVTNTSDGSDNQAIYINGGGATNDANRGALIVIAGNEHGNTGKLQLSAGNVVGGDIIFNTENAERARLTKAGVFALGTTVTTGVTAGEMVIPVDRWYKGVNRTANGAVNLIASVDMGVNTVRVGSGSAVVTIGAPSTVTGAGGGDLVFPNSSKGIRAANAAATGTFGLLFANSSDQLVLAFNGNDIKWGTALVALGGGAAPTLGTIGGSGPATAAQNTWMRVVDSTGAAFWVPVWK